VVGWDDWGIRMVFHMEKRFFSCSEYPYELVIVKNWVWRIIHALIIHHTWRRSTLFLFLWIIKYSGRVINICFFLFFYFNTVPCIFYYFIQWTNKCAMNWQIIILLLHVSTLLCHLQGAHCRYLAKLHKYVNVVVGDTI
jgi:hypothetical protein